MRVYRCGKCGQLFLFASRISAGGHILCPRVLVQAIADKGIMGLAGIRDDPPQWPNLEDVTEEMSNLNRMAPK